MHAIARTAIACALAAAFLPTLHALQTRAPETSPVVVDFDDPPATMKTGDEVTTTIIFRLLADVDKLEIFLDPDDGLELVAPTPSEFEFSAVKKRETRQIQVKVKLTDPKGSSLNVSWATTAQSGEGFGSTVIDYGEARH
jgi:hypothetical protein